MKKLAKDWKPEIIKVLLNRDAPRNELYKLVGANSLGAITKSLDVLINEHIILEVPCSKDKPECKKCYIYQKRQTIKKIGRPRKNAPRPKNVGPKTKCLTLNTKKIRDIVEKYPETIKAIQNSDKVISYLHSFVDCINISFLRELIKSSEEFTKKFIKNLDNVKKYFNDLLETPIILDNINFLTLYYKYGHTLVFFCFNLIPYLELLNEAKPVFYSEYNEASKLYNEINNIQIYIEVIKEKDMLIEITLENFNVYFKINDSELQRKLDEIEIKYRLKILYTFKKYGEPKSITQLKEMLNEFESILIKTFEELQNDILKHIEVSLIKNRKI